MTDFELIAPDWEAPPQVRACATTRAGGTSEGHYARLNLAAHVGDDPAAVTENRACLQQQADLPAEPAWLTQVHGNDIVAAAELTAPVEADASWTATAGVVCAVMTADCLPVLLCDREGTQVAAVHAGWRGLGAGILERAVAEFAAAGIPAERILAWLGPAIGPEHYEIDEPVREAFAARLPDTSAAFRAARRGHWYLDLYAVARAYLAAAGVKSVSGGDYCTYSDQRFFSHRRQPGCGRQASLIWIAD